MIVTLPDDLVKDIERRDKDHSKFVAEAVRHELDRRLRAELRRSLDNPHPDSADLVEQGFGDWKSGLPEEDVASLVDDSAGKAIRWVAGKGWIEGSS